MLAGTLLQSPMSIAQGNGCDEGVIRLPDRSGTIQICSTLASQVPKLAGQLDAATKTLGNQEQQLKELMRLIKGLNGVSAGIGADRQSQMLKTLSSDLGRAQEKGVDKTKQSIENLSQQIEDLRDQIVAALSNNKTAGATRDALKGPLGDEIARLEFSSASRSIENIAKRLEFIQSDVTVIKSNTDDIRQQLAKAEADRLEQKQSDMEFLAKMERENEERIAALKRQSADSQKAEQVKQVKQLKQFSKNNGIERLDFFLSPVNPGNLLSNAITEVSYGVTSSTLNWEKAVLKVVFKPQTPNSRSYDLSKKIKTDKLSQKANFEIDFNPVGTWAVCATTLDFEKTRLITAVKLVQVSQIKSSLVRVFLDKELTDDVEIFELTDSRNPCRS